MASEINQKNDGIFPTSTSPPEAFPPYEVVPSESGSSRKSDIEPPVLKPELSQQHWDAASVEMARYGFGAVWAGETLPDWVHYLERQQITRKGKVVRKVDKVSEKREYSGETREIYRDSYTLPIVKRCHACIHVTENITGKGVNKHIPRCKNKTYGKYCHVHTDHPSSPSYIV